MIIYKICLYHKWNEYKKAQAFPEVKTRQVILNVERYHERTVYREEHGERRHNADLLQEHHLT